MVYFHIEESFTKFFCCLSSGELALLLLDPFDVALLQLVRLLPSLLSSLGIGLSDFGQVALMAASLVIVWRLPARRR